MDNDKSNGALNPALLAMLMGNGGQSGGLNPAMLQMLLQNQSAPGGIDPQMLAALSGQSAAPQGNGLNPALLQAIMGQPAAPAHSPQSSFSPQQLSELQGMLGRLQSRSNEEWMQIVNTVAAQQRSEGGLDMQRVEQEMQNLLPMLDKNAQMKLREIMGNLRKSG